VRATIAAAQPRVSPFVALELAYMHEIGRARDSVPAMLAALRRDTGLEVAEIPLVELIDAAIDISWTRDPFDRLIAAHAIVADVPLITADEMILEHLPLATWG